MITPNILYYARLEFDTTSKKTPKYVVTTQAGYYPPMEAITGRNGKISMFLMESTKTKLKEGANVPPIRLQAKNSLNFTGLKDYFVDGKLSGYAYGNPPQDETYSGKKRQNPFFECKEDGYLFVIHQDGNLKKEGKIIPTSIELIVLEDAKVLISSYCKQLMMGGFNEVLDALRKQAK